MKRLLLSLFLFAPLLTTAQRVTRNMNNDWTFAIDPVKTGESNRWYDTAFPSANFDKVKLPHCFSVDPRYQFYTGTAWYFKTFDATADNGKHVFLKFDAVFYKARIWLNGVLAGDHEGGYTPFELDVTNLLRKRNVLAVQVDNSWDTTTLPGAKTSVSYEPPNAAQVFPWVNYGGITRPVNLIIRPATYIYNSKITANPDLKKMNALVHVRAFIKNASLQTVERKVTATIYFQGRERSVHLQPKHVTLIPGAVAIVDFEGTMPRSEVKLWNQDEPHLYTARITCNTDTLTSSFGIRKVEVSGTRLLLNGAPVKMGGANRPLDFPGYGSMDPAEVLQQDLTLFKNAGMELSRISHYPVSESLLNWADEHGLLIIEEAGNWQMTPKQMSDALMRNKFRSQMKEMVERGWNHPCIIAYSLGNEFKAQTKEGRAWVKDMRMYVRFLDNTRLITFASNTVYSSTLTSPEEEASQYVDFISTNIYGNYQEALRNIHKLYPGKPVYISEFGIRADAVKTEEERVLHLRKAMEDFRQFDFVIGASIWTFNDYISRFPGSNANGYRPWGLVTPERALRGMYKAWQEEFAPVVIGLLKKQNGQVAIQVTARKDFPAYPLKGYQVKYNGKEKKLPTLQPGESTHWSVSLEGDQVEVELIKPGGYLILKKTYSVQK